MKISDKKKEKISEQILALLYSINPQSLFTLHIAREIARDEEFIKKILFFTISMCYRDYKQKKTASGISPTVQNLSEDNNFNEATEKVSTTSSSMAAGQ